MGHVMLIFEFCICFCPPASPSCLSSMRGTSDENSSEDRSASVMKLSSSGVICTRSTPGSIFPGRKIGPSDSGNGLNKCTYEVEQCLVYLYPFFTNMDFFKSW